MTFEIGFVFAVVVATMLLFVSERFRPDQVAIAVPVVLLSAGMIGVDQALAGFASQATITVAAMLVLGLGLTRTGAVEGLSRWALGAPASSPGTRTFTLCVIVAGISPFLNNTAVVVIFLPVFLALARQAGTPTSKVLIPLSYAAILGGTVTLVGTSTNLIVSGMARARGLDDLGVFSIAPLGLVNVLLGLAYLFTVGRRLLPDREAPPDLSAKYDVRSFVTELRIEEGSPLVGENFGELDWGHRHGIALLGVQRRAAEGPGSGPLSPLRAGDILLARGDAKRLLRLARDRKLSPPSAWIGPTSALGDDDAKLVELVVAPGSHVAGRTLAEARFRQRHDAVVLAIQHLGTTVFDRLPNVRLAVGDLLLVHGSAAALADLADEPGLVPLGEVERPAPDRPRAVVAVTILAGVVIAAGTGIVTIASAALAGVTLMVFTGCVRMDELYRDLDWSVVFLLAGLIPLGIAMDETGAAEWIARGVVGVLGPLPAFAAVAAFYLLASVLTEMMSNNATAVVLTPIALVSAVDLGLNPYALIVAVMFGASASFMTPVGYQTNTLVYGPGGYRFADYLKVGAPLNLLLLLTATLLIPILWPS